MAKGSSKKRKPPARSYSGPKMPQVLKHRVRQEQALLTEWISQLCLDVIVGVLNDSDVMGKDTFGAKRLMRIGEAFNERFPIYLEALTPSVEADYRRSKIDQEQKRIFGPDYLKWSERYHYFED